MFKVECPGCKAPYQVDERRVPKAGLKMRCPKCGTSFKVDSPDEPSEAPPPVLGAALGLKGSERPSPQRAPGAGLKSTMLGVAAPAGLLDDHPAKPKRPPPPRRPPPAKPGLPSPDEDPYSEAELPMLGGAPGGRRRGTPDREPSSDLPALRPAPPRAPSAGADVDLPAPVQQRERDLPAVPPRRRNDGFDIDLPAVGHSEGEGKNRQDAALELDLPTPSADLPSPAGGAELPLLSLDSVLPSTGAGLPARAAELPSPRSQPPGIERPSPGRNDLPSPAQSLPDVADRLPEVVAGATSLPSRLDALPLTANALPSPANGSMDAVEQGESGGLASFSLPPEDALDLESGGASEDFNFGELELPLGSDPFAGSAAGTDLSSVPPAVVNSFGMPGASPEGATSDPPQAESSGSSVHRQAGGGTSFGEVNLIGDDAPAAEFGIDDVRPPQVSQTDEDMEFGGIPQEEALDNQGATAGAAQVRMHVGALPPESAKKSKGLRIALGAFILVCIGGGALALVPEVGPFGYYALNDMLRSGEYQALTKQAIVDARHSLAKDTFPAAVEAVERVEAVRESAPRVHGLAAYSAFVAFARELRFGMEPEVHARAKVTLDELKEASDVPHLPLAQAAQAAVDGDLTTARQMLKNLLNQPGEALDAQLVLAEVALKAGDAKAATEAWQRARKLEDSARTRFGLARARLLADDMENAEKFARQAMETQPDHAGAKLLVARITSERPEGEEETLKLLDSVIGQKGGKLSPHELVVAQTLQGDTYLKRSRISSAEAAYDKALEIEPRESRALEGLGNALYAAARYSEALARYEAAAQADPRSLRAKIGIVKCKLALERVKEASALADSLRQSYPKSFVAALWQGRAFDALGNREQAESAYRAAVELSGKDEAAVEAYVALAGLLNQEGKADEAQALLDKARSDLRDSPAIHRALGDVALAQGRFDDAISEYDAALQLDSDDLRAMFQRGVALRRARRLDDAQTAFDRVAKIDPEYPGLPLERGLLHEAAGRADQALQEYEAALAKAPQDLDLMLRVGCSNVLAGHGKEAEKLLRKVLQQRSNSAEANYCLGRALLLDPARLADALRLLERAAAIDPNRPEYHLYVGWAANEARDFRKAEKSLERALSLDQSLADAYWQRGVLLARQGAVKDAIVDLKKALELRPTRYEAHASLADVYYDLGKEQQALREWKQAVSAIPDEPAWRFRYGKLLLANRQVAAAKQELSAALEQAAKEDTEPRWLYEAHQLLAQALGDQPAAAEHWEAFLERAPLDSPYRAEAKRALRKLGQPWKGN